MNRLSHLVRRLLACRGYELRRLCTPLYDLDDFIAQEAASAASLKPLEIHVFDSEPRIQRGLLRAPAVAAVRFHGVPGLADLPALPAPPARLWMFVGGAWDQANTLVALRPLIAAADCLLYRLGPAEAVGAGLPEVVALAEQAGLRWEDVLTSLQPVPFNAAANRHFLLFRRSQRGPLKTSSIQRMDEAGAFLVKPVARSRDFRLLAGRGSLGFAAGLFNPGSIDHGERRMVLMRAERVPWAIQEGSERIHLESCAAVAGCVAPDGALADTAPVVLRGHPDPGHTRTEDYRLFAYRGRLLCSHSLITPAAGQAPREQPLRVEDLDTRMAVSELDYAKRELRLVAVPQADFTLNKTEKNWAFFASGDDLLAIYSIKPYRLLRSPDWPTATFRTHLEEKVELPFGSDDRPIRNSINPVIYDSRHLLHIVHKVYPSKQYVFWALLIDRQTLRPVYALDRPLVRAGPSVAAAIVYACSALVSAGDVLVLAGVDDCACGFWRLPRQDLDARWRPLSPPVPAA